MRPCLANIVETMCTIAASTNVEEGVRHQALELLVCMAEAEPSMVRKYKGFVVHTVPVCLQLMCEVDEEEDWSIRDEKVDMSDLDNSPACGEQCLVGAGVGDDLADTLLVLTPPPFLLQTP